jgi:hypothetical protein
MGQCFSRTIFSQNKHFKSNYIYTAIFFTKISLITCLFKKNAYFVDDDLSKFSKNSDDNIGPSNVYFSILPCLSQDVKWLYDAFLLCTIEKSHPVNSTQKLTLKKYLHIIIWKGRTLIPVSVTRNVLGKGPNVTQSNPDLTQNLC